MNEDSVLCVVVKLISLDLDITITKLYIHIPYFRKLLSKDTTITYLCRKLRLYKCESFPELCVDLSIMNPITSRIPRRVCLKLCASYNYCVIDIFPNIDLDLVLECCLAISNIKEEGGDIYTEASTALGLLGKERTKALLEGKVNTYSTGMIICLALSGYNEELAQYIDDESNSIYRDYIMQETSKLVELYTLPDDSLSEMFLNRYGNNLRHTIVGLCRGDHLEVIKNCIASGYFDITDLFDLFDSLQSFSVFKWLYTEHNYHPSAITHHHSGYNGTCVDSLKLLYEDTGYIPRETIVEAIRLSDDVDALVWMRDNGLLDKVSYTTIETYGITQEITAPYAKGITYIENVESSNKYNTSNGSCMLQ